MEENNSSSDNSFYWLLLAVTTVAVAISFLVLFVVLASKPKLQRLSQQQFNQPALQPTTQAPTQTTQSQTQSQAETWVFKGYALGKKIGNENAMGVFMSEVAKLDNGRYRMYYGWAGQGGTGIKSAISVDGKTWTVETGFRLQGASDKTDRENIISGPSVVKMPDGRYRMYYQSSPQNPPNQAPKFHVRSAVSNDGLNFTREGVRIDIEPYSKATGLTVAGHGTYFIARDGTYVGIFSGNLGNENAPSDLIMATSKDGLSFTGFKKLYQSWHDPIVVRTNQGYKIYSTYMAEKQGTAVSADGLNWPSEMTTILFQNAKGEKLTEGNSGVGDLGGVVRDDGSIVIYSNWGSQQSSENIVYFEKE